VTGGRGIRASLHYDAGVLALQDLTAETDSCLEHRFIASVVGCSGAATGPPLRRGRVYVYAYNDTI